MGYMLKSVDSDGGAYGGFMWPLEVGAIVKSETWDPTPECGNGLHGLDDGMGNLELLNWIPEAKWLVCKYDTCVIIDAEKIKCPQVTIMYIGTLVDVLDYMQGLTPNTERCQRYAERCQRYAERYQRYAERSQQDAEQYQRYAEQSQQDAEQYQWNAKQSQWNAEQSQRYAEQYQQYAERIRTLVK